MYSPSSPDNNFVGEVNDNNEYSMPLFPNSLDNCDSYNCRLSDDDFNDIFTQTSSKEDTDNDENEEDISEINSLFPALNHVEKLVVSNILATLKKRYSSLQNIMKLLQITSFLDPRHRNKYLGDQDQIFIIHNEIKLEMKGPNSLYKRKNVLDGSNECVCVRVHKRNIIIRNIT